MKKKKDNKFYNYLTIITFILVLACFIKIFITNKENKWKEYSKGKFFISNVYLYKSDESLNYYDEIIFKLHQQGSYNYENNGLQIYLKCYDKNNNLVTDDLTVYMNGYFTGLNRYRLIPTLDLNTSYCELNGVEVFDSIIEDYEDPVDKDYETKDTKVEEQ